MSESRKERKGISHGSSYKIPIVIFSYFPVEYTSITDPVSSLSGGECDDLIGSNSTKQKKGKNNIILNETT